MESPLFNLIIFSIVALFLALLFWPRLGFFQAVRGRFLMSKRTQLEDALKFIHNANLDEGKATTSALADSLNLSETKVFALTDHMSRTGLISISDGRVHLTKEGEQYALQIIRAHRLFERYLADETSLDPKEWHTKAEEYEHKITADEIESLADRLGDPLFDPHGDPIPTAEGEYQSQKLINLTEFPIGKSARVMHMEDEPESIYEQLLASGIYLGMEFSFKEKSSENYVLETNERTFTISPQAAQNLSIEEIEKIKKSEEKISRESLNDLEVGEKAKIVQISPMCRGFERRRLMDLGIVPDTIIQYYQDGLMGGLKAFTVRGTVLALRNEQVRMISISDRKRVNI